ncbi:MAG: ATP-binding protein [Rhodobacteraceae bacterium]|nr:MAG: ATP-binding protein [Paracoccaceae bacterium]
MTPEAVLAALGGVAAPDGRALPDTGRLSPVLAKDGRVSVAITAPPGEAAAYAPVRAAAERAIRAIPGVTKVFVALTAETGPAPQRDAPDLSPAKKGKQPVEGVRAVIAVASGKGGVGKSTTACNLAVALRARGLRVGVLDADVYGPSQPRLFGLRGRPRVREGRILEPLDGYGVKVMSIGALVDDETAMVWRGPMAMAAITQMLREVAWAPLDVLLVDMPPGTGDAQLAMAQSTPLAGAVIVSTPQDLALIDARRGIAMFRKVDVPILGVIENMAHYVCPTCGTQAHIFGHGGAEAEAARQGVPFLGAVPLTMALRESADAGRPVAALDPDGPVGAAYAAIAARLAAAIPAV